MADERHDRQADHRRAVQQQDDRQQDDRQQDDQQRADHQVTAPEQAGPLGEDHQDTAPLAAGRTRQDDPHAQHVERVARLIARRLRAPGGELFTLLDADRLNDSAGWTYRYVTPSGNVVRAEGVSLPSDALFEAWKLAQALANDTVAA